MERFRASGPGGQHINRSESAVRITYPAADDRAAGITAQCQDHRHRARNQADALARLRLRLACRLRGLADSAWMEPWRSKGGRITLGARADDFPSVAACCLDALTRQAGSLAQAAGELGVTTSQLVKLLGADAEVLQEATRIRSENGLGAIHVR